MPQHRVAMATLASLAFVGASDPVATGPEDDDPTAPRPVLSNADGSNLELSGVAQIIGSASTCTGFLVDTIAVSTPAVMMTNGHCVGLFDATTILSDEPAPDGTVARFGLFADTPDDVVEVPVTAVAYATMRATDVAFLELDITLEELLDKGIAAYRLGQAPRDGDQISVVGIPVNGVDPDDQVLRGATCTAGSSVRLVEFEWLWDAALASDCAGILGGSSGSPVFLADDPSTVVGIINTTTIGAGAGGSCYLGQPCEMTDDGEVEVANRTYAMPVDDWARCFTGSFAPQAPGCPVEPEPSVTVQAPLRAVSPGATWSATIDAPEPPVDIVVKSGAAATIDCRDVSGYAPLAGPFPRTYDEPLPSAEGIYVLCAAALGSTGAPVIGAAGYAVMQVDGTPPTIPIGLSVQVGEGGDAMVEPLFVPPEQSSFFVKFGPVAETDCSVVDDGYAVYRRVPITVPAEQQPATVCVIAEDEAGNFGQPQSFAIP